MKNFITIEGGEGSGKSTIIKEIAKEFDLQGIPYILTREPGGCKIAEQIRNVILNKENTDMDVIVEAMLYAASRKQHIERVIKPALAEGKVVLCDRYIDSNLIYQGIGRKLGIDKVLEINKPNLECMPELTLYFDIEPELGLKRIAKNKNREVNRLDLEKNDFYERIRTGFLDWANNNDRIVTIDASGDVQHVTNLALDAIFSNKKDN